MTAIKKCTCKNAYQDKKYGKGLRVHNSCGGNKSNPKWRCTVCVNEKD